jgi:hypothetical protein
MEINSLDDLNKLEIYIGKILENYKLADILYSLYQLKNKSPKFEPFMIAGFSLFATRFCTPSNSFDRPIPHDIESLLALSNEYYLADPITFDKELYAEFINSTSDFTLLRPLLRLQNNQFSFNKKLYSQFSRSYLLFHEIPKELQNSQDIPHTVQAFDFESKFQAVTGVSVIDFITTGFVIASEFHKEFIINKNNFTKIRNEGINIPNDEIVKNILSQIVANKFKMIELYEERIKTENKNPRFKMYNFNPLLSYPIIEVCDTEFLSDEYHLHAPIPNLVDSRFSSLGIFYQMYNIYKTEFSQYFGYIFENYVGLLIKNSITSEILFSEKDIRKVYPDNKGKVPDWILIDGSTLILFECKATRFTRAAQAIASEEAIEDSLKQVIAGLKQLFKFKSACQSKVKELTEFHACTTFIPVLVSLEPLYQINNTEFREYVNTLLVNSLLAEKEEITNFEWQILSIDELEVLQPYLADGFKLSQVLDNLRTKTYEEIYQELNSHTNKTFANSFLYPHQVELYQRLNYKHNIN